MDKSKQTVNVLDIRTLEKLQELIGGDRADLKELIETFLIEGDEIVADMQTAITTADVVLLRRAAHSLKSSAQDFGAIQLATLCATLEAAGKSEIPDTVSSQVSDIAKHYTTAKLELKVYIES